MHVARNAVAADQCTLAEIMRCDEAGLGQRGRTRERLLDAVEAVDVAPNQAHCLAASVAAQRAHCLGLVQRRIEHERTRISVMRVGHQHEAARIQQLGIALKALPGEIAREQNAAHALVHAGVVVQHHVRLAAASEQACVAVGHKFAGERRGR